MTPASLSVSASVFDATPGDASTIAATCDGQLRTNARRPSATGGWGSRKRVHRRLLVCLRLFDLTRRRVMEFEGSRARVPWGGRESAVDALPPRGCRPLRRIAVFYLCGHAGARDEVCAPPSRLGQVLFVQHLYNAILFVQPAGFQ